MQGGMTGDLSLMCPEFVQVPFYIIKVTTTIFTTIIWSGFAYYKLTVQSFFAGIAASGAITAALRFFTKAVFENSRDGLRKGASMFIITIVPFTVL